MTRSMSLHDSIRPILGAIRSVPVPAHVSPDAPPGPPAPFITVSRQPGAGAWTMAQQLIEALNTAVPGDQPWTCWDKELVEKIVADTHLSARVVESLEDRGHSWITDFLGSLSVSDDASQADESRVYARVAQTIRALAQTGRVLIVGRGGVFITRKMPGGVHIRLVAPLEKRVEFMAREYNLTFDRAAARIKELERNRQAFYKHYWPSETLAPETFALTVNTAVVDIPTMIQMIAVLVQSKVSAMAR
jgi:cytidylate kinase